MDTVRALKQSFLFKDLPQPLLELIARAADEISLPAGETLVCPGDTPDTLYVIRSGTVRATGPDANTPPALFGTGETIGEVQFIDGAPAGMSAVALEKVDLLAIRRHKLAAALDKDPRAGYELYRAIARSLAARVRRVFDVLVFASEREHRS